MHHQVVAVLPRRNRATTLSVGSPGFAVLNYRPALMSLRWCLVVVVGLLACDDSERPAAPPFRARARVGSRGNFVGVFQPETAAWQLRLQRPGWNEPEGERTFVFGAPGDTPVVGDWDGDGAQTPGTFREGTWLLSNVLDANGAPLTFRFGRTGDLPVVGDWDGDGVATVGLFKDGTFSLRNTNSEGDWDVRVSLGGPGDVPVAGDWDGDGVDTVGIYTPVTGNFGLLDAEGNETTVELKVSMAQPVVGDWDDNRRDTVGVHLGVDWTLLNDHRAWERRDKAASDYGPDAEVYGLGEIALGFGEFGAIPVTGNWLPFADRGFPDPGSELREFFPLAADYQNPDSFEGWRDAGVNTVIRVRSKADPKPADATEIEAWTTKATELGLKMIREPREDEGGEADVLAWIMLDEPDIQSMDLYDHVERTAIRVQGSHPVLINFAGWSVQRQTELIRDVSPKYGPGDRNPSDFYSRYVALTDWVSQDIYAISQMFVQQSMSVDDAMATLPLTFAKLRRWAPTQPQFAYIETSQHNGTSRLVSPDEFRAQVWLAVVGGMRGIFYFAANDCGHPQCIQPDGTQPDVRDEMRKQNARVARLTHELQGEVNPLAFSVSAAAPLETAWRSSDDGNYIIAVNGTSRTLERWIRIEGKLATGAIEVFDEERTLETLEGYAFKDTFPPLGVRVYRFR
jgi:hypothetical protein